MGFRKGGSEENLKRKEQIAWRGKEDVGQRAPQAKLGQSDLGEFERREREREGQQDQRMKESLTSPALRSREGR